MLRCFSSRLFLRFKVELFLFPFTTLKVNHPLLTYQPPRFRHIRRVWEVIGTRNCAWASQGLAAHQSRQQRSLGCQLPIGAYFRTASCACIPHYAETAFQVVPTTLICCNFLHPPFFSLEIHLPKNLSYTAPMLCNKKRGGVSGRIIKCGGNLRRHYCE